MDNAFSEVSHPPESREKVAELIRRVLEGSEEERNDVFRELMQLMNPTIRRVEARFSIQNEEFYYDVCSKVYESLQKFDPGRSFEAWVYQLAKNLAIEKYREKKRRREVPLLRRRSRRAENGEKYPTLPVDLVPDPCSEVRSIIDTLSIREPFCKKQLDKLSTLPVKRRVVTLVGAGLHRRIPANIWENWCRELGVQGEFPPPELEELDTFEDRIRCLAQLLDLGEAGIRQHCFRSRAVFKEVLSKD